MTFFSVYFKAKYTFFVVLLKVSWTLATVPDEQVGLASSVLVGKFPN